MSQTNRDEVILAALLEHPFLHDGISAESAYNYLLGRTHYDRRQEKWRESSRKTAFWLIQRGFIVVRSGSKNKYFWMETGPTTSEE